MIDILELQPTSKPLLPVVESFSIPTPPQGGGFSFSPVSFHASFVSYMGIVILGVQDSKTLLQTKAIRVPYNQTSGGFSPNGHFFACGTLQDEICIWENTSAGYVPWSTLRPRLQFTQFSLSPTAISILGWGSGGIQLLNLENDVSSPPHSEVEPPYQGGTHLVAFSTDRMHIVTVRKWDGIITVLNLSNTMQQSIDTNVQIQDIKMIDNTIIMTDGRKLIHHHLGTGGMVLGVCSDRRGDITIPVYLGYECLTLSNDCSQIAFSFEGTVFLYDIEAQKVLGELTTSGYIENIQFSPDGHQLLFIVRDSDKNISLCHHVDLERTRDPCFTKVNVGNLEGEWSCDSLFRSPHEYQITGSGSEWISDSRGNVLWLPPSWRTRHGLEARWNGNFLFLMGGHNPGPIIVEFHPSPVLPDLCSTRLSGACHYQLLHQ